MCTYHKLVVRVKRFMVDVIRRMQEAPELAAPTQVTTQRQVQPTRAGITDLALLLIKRKKKTILGEAILLLPILKTSLSFM